MKYLFKVTEVIEVEAESAEEAEKLINSGEGEITSTNFERLE